jgi:ferrous iron transport protein B
MACGAKLPVFLLLSGVFFAGNEANIMMAMILAGWVFALVIARLLRSTIIRGESTPFVLELPPYRMPTLRSVITHCWERTWMYIKKAGTVLVAISVVIWIGLTFPTLSEEEAVAYQSAIALAEDQLQALDGTADSEQIRELQASIENTSMEWAEAELRHSFAGRMGIALEPLTMPAGFDWRVDVAILGGIAAKEALVSTLGTAYSLGAVDPEDVTSLAERLAADPHWSPAKALALMLFVLLYSPCFVALIVIRQEAGSWRWLAFSVLFNTTLAYMVAVLVYQVGIRM